MNAMQIETEVYHGNIRYLVFTRYNEDTREFVTVTHRHDLIQDWKIIIDETRTPNSKDAKAYHAEMLKLIG